MLPKILFTVMFMTAACLTLRAQSAGSLDPTFSEDGKIIVPIGTANGFGRAMTIQPDGKAVVACVANNGTDSDFALMRFTTAGDLDFEMSDDGMVLTDFNAGTDIAEAIAVDNFNRIILAGSFETIGAFGLGAARYLSDGTLDETFGDQGLVTMMLGNTGFCKAVAVQEDNKIVLGGYVLNPVTLTNEFVLIRFTTDGIPDSTFHEDGIVQTNMGIGAGVANAILIQPDKKIVLAGQVFNEATFRWEIGIARYNEDGSLDPAWDEDGIVFTGLPDADFTIKAIAMQADKKIVVGGFFGTAPSNTLFALARYHLDGSMDKTFGDEGILLDSYGAQNSQINTVVLQPDGQILIAGTSLQGNRDKFAIARLDPNGAFDETFGDLGVVTPTIEQNDGIHSMALQQDGKLMVAGESFNGQRFSIAAARIETGLMTSADDPHLSNIQTCVFPNPVRDEIHVRCNVTFPTLLHMTLVDQSGRIIYETSNLSTHVAGENEMIIELPMYVQNGIYTLGLVSGENASALQVLVIR